MRFIAVPRELKPTSPAFLRGHYSTGVREAAAMAVYAQRRSVAIRARCRTAAARDGGGPGGSHGRGRPASPVNRIPIRPSHRTRRRLQQSGSLDRHEL